MRNEKSSLKPICFSQAFPNLFAMQNLKSERFHLAIERLIVEHKCGLVLQNLVNDQSRFAAFLAGVAMGRKVKMEITNEHVEVFPTCKPSRPHK